MENMNIINLRLKNPQSPRRGKTVAGGFGLLKPKASPKPHQEPVTSGSFAFPRAQDAGQHSDPELQGESNNNSNNLGKIEEKINDYSGNSVQKGSNENAEGAAPKPKQTVQFTFKNKRLKKSKTMYRRKAGPRQPKKEEDKTSLIISQIDDNSSRRSPSIVADVALKPKKQVGSLNSD